jgi:hypothetical protein
LPRRTDRPERPGTLPLPELSPTLNPVLGQNMGRWAQVYFTTPPDQREQAVMELLRTLEAENPPREENDAFSPSARDQISAPPHLSDSQGADDLPTLMNCPACGRENPADQRYCGMCGAPLETGPIPSDRAREDSPRVRPGPPVQNWHSQFLPHEEPGEFSRARDGREYYSSDEILNRSYDYNPPTSSPYRIYVGGALAVIVMALAYMAWRGAQVTSGSSQLSPPAPPAVASQAAAAVPTANAPKAVTSERSSAVAEPADQEAGTRRTAETATPAWMTAKDPDTKSPQAMASPSSGNGSEELAIARRYLNATDGQRNSAEAVDWLWKAVAKRNAEATLLLSDVFLKGVGVPQNCDQARVLLDAAASRGSKDAAERLRHLQAFGCR